MKAVDRFTALAPGILGVARILVGVMFACHGAQKLFHMFGGMPPGVPKAFLWTAGPLELIGGTLIAIGLCTRVTAFILGGMMAFAYFIGHAHNGFWPITNGGELAILYCWLFLVIAAYGGGSWALDNQIRNHKPSA